MADKNPFWNKITKPIRDSKINNILKNVPIEKSVPWDKEFTFAERLACKQKLFAKLPVWLSNYFSGFDALPEKYVCCGNSDSLNHIIMQRKFNKIYTLDNEYNYYGYICQELHLERIIFNRSTLDQITSDDLVLVSIPSSYDGSADERTEIIKILQERNIPIYIDVAYCGLTTPFHLNIVANKNTYFAFTFSKTLSIGFNRIAVLYAGQPVPGLEIMNKIGYVNLSGINYASALIDQLPVDYIYNTYKDQYENICNQLSLQPTQCILFGHDGNKQKFCVTEEYVVD